MESEQIRREVDNVGPRAELDYWRKRMARFNFLLDQIKMPEVKAVLNVLQMAKSKSIQVNLNLANSRIDVLVPFCSAMESTRHENNRCGQ